MSLSSRNGASLKVGTRSNHQAYLPIVASASHAATLHYCCNDKEFAWGPIGSNDHNSHSLVNGRTKELNPQVLLIDAGCEWDCYASDSESFSDTHFSLLISFLSPVTRTMPVGNGGKFTPEARAIYDLVLEMQKVMLWATIRNHMN